MIKLFKTFVVTLFLAASLTVPAFAKSAHELKRLAGQGDASAQYLLGVSYFSGTKGLTEDKNKAAQWFLKAAQNGHTQAQVESGLNYGAGKYGLPKDPVKAFTGR